jgi:hypothetical protein
MRPNFYRSIEEPNRNGLTWEELWKGLDNGLIACWERGRVKAADSPDLAESCKNGELPVLAWKGGVDKKIKGKKYGSLFYLATWQGLRGEDLSINLHQDIAIICSKTNAEVIFTPNLLTYEISKLEELES